MSQILAQLQALANLATVNLWPALVVFLRVGAMMSLMPAFGETAVPQRIRLILALAFSTAIAPAVWDRLPPDASVPVLLIEVVVGLMLGAGLRFFIFALQMAGTMIAQATSLAQVFGGMSEAQPAVGHLLVMAGLAIAVLSGLPLRIAELLILSYDVLPVGHLPSAQDAVKWGVAGVAQVFRLALQIAAPFIVASLIYNLALGFINRAMPALMVSFIGAPALSAGGLILLAILTPIALPVWQRALEGFMASPFATVP